MYAIVDIETTGGHASANGITEVAIILYNGKEVEGKYQTLVNPNMPIQKYVQALTGITDAMVKEAPQFSTLAANIHNLLKDRIFVAHNVNFDYSFIKHQLQQEGYELNTRKLCTIRLARKIFPGLPKYGLESICRELNIHHGDRHRAAGDATATTQLFELLLQNDKEGELNKMLKQKNGEHYLPPHVNSNLLKKLPYVPGVYYFHNKKGKIIYVGKAKNLKRRVTSHFSNNKPSKQKQEFLREIHDITFKEYSSDLVASIMESIEIKRLWPAYNKSQKHFEQRYAIYLFEDAKGYYRLGIDKKKKHLQPIASFRLWIEAHRTLWKMVKEFSLHPSLCFLDKNAVNEFPEVNMYNGLVEQAIAAIQAEQKTYVVHDAASNYILVEEGKFYGLSEKELKELNDVEEIKKHFTPYPENEVIHSLLRSYIERYPERIIAFTK
jgi:DNA polymerase-3 subunit epsilon